MQRKNIFIKLTVRVACISEKQNARRSKALRTTNAISALFELRPRARKILVRWWWLARKLADGGKYKILMYMVDTCD